MIIPQKFIRYGEKQELPIELAEPEELLSILLIENGNSEEVYDEFKKRFPKINPKTIIPGIIG